MPAIDDVLLMTRRPPPQLLTYDPSKALPVSSFPLTILPEAHLSINCFQALDYLYAVLSVFDHRLELTLPSQTGRAHLLLISRTPGKAGGAVGVITLEGRLRHSLPKESAANTPHRYHRGILRFCFSRAVFIKLTSFRKSSQRKS